jgi:hypothetical protein
MKRLNKILLLYKNMPLPINYKSIITQLYSLHSYYNRGKNQRSNKVFNLEYPDRIYGRNINNKVV